MADLTRIQFKRSKTPNVRPAPDTVAEGEIILNLADRAILTKLGNEIIDLGFAKGGKVDGNIDLNGNFDQKNGNITTTGNLTVNGKSNLNSLTITEIGDYSGIDIKHGDKYLRLQNMPIGLSEFASISKRDADGTQTSSFKIPIGIGTAATQEWTNSLIKSNGFSTIVRNPNGTDRLCIVANNSGEAGAYDYANNRWAFVHNQAGFKVFGSGEFQSPGDYASVILKKSDGRFVQIETKPHAGSTDMLNFIYRQADGTNQHVMSLPYETGTIASKEFVNTMVHDLGNGVALRGPRNSTEIANNDDGNMGFWDRNTNRWVLVAHATGNTTITNSGLNIKSAKAGDTSSKMEIISPNDKFKIGLWAYNDGRNLLSAYSNGAWNNTEINHWGTIFNTGRIQLKGPDNSGSNRPQLIIDSTADKWRIEPDGSGKLQFVHEGSNALYEMEKIGGTYQLATKQWVNSQGFQKGSSNKQYSRALRTLTGIRGNTWGSHTRGIEFGENLNNRIVFLESQNGTGFLIGNQRTVLSDDVAAWTEDNYVKYSWRANTSSPSAHKVTIMEFY